MELQMQGLGVVNATPFTDNDEIDETVYVEHVRSLFRDGASYVVPAAATGEFISLDETERRRLVQLAVDASEEAGRVVAYAGRPTTRETVDALRAARDAGAHAAYIVQPWFSKPDQEGLYRHFRDVAMAVDDIPLIIYNNPDRTSCEITHQTMERVLDDVPSYMGIKDADHSSLIETFARFADRLPVWPRSEREMLWALASGAPGVLSFSGNYMTRELVGVLKLWTEGDTAAARAEYLRIYPLMQSVFLQPVPATVKFVLSELGYAFGDPRQPISAVYDSVRGPVLEAMDSVGLK